MALTEKQKEEMRAYAQKLKTQQAPPTDMRAYAQQLKAGQAQQQEPSDEGFLDQASGAVNSAYEAFGTLPGVKQFSQTVGGAAQMAGMGVAATLSPLMMLTNMALGRNAMDNVKETILDTGGFGKETGEAAGVAALVPGGRVVQGALGAAQMYQGAKDSYQGIKEGDAEKALTGGIELGTALWGLKGAKGKTKVPGELPPPKQGLVFSSPIKEMPGKLANTAMSMAPKSVRAPIEQAIQSRATSALANANRELLNMTPTQAQGEAKWHKDTPQFLADEGVVAGFNDGNKFNGDHAIETLKPKYQAEAEAFKGLLAEEPRYFSLTEWGKNILNEINTPEFKARGGDAASARKYIVKEVKALGQEFADQGFVSDGDLLLPSVAFDTIKTGRWDKSFGNKGLVNKDSIVKSADFTMGKVAQTMIETAYKDNVDISAGNKRLGQFASAIDLITSRNEKTVSGGKYFKPMMSRLIGAVIGGAGGNPITALGGSMAAENLAKILASSDTKAAVAKKVLDKLGQSSEGRSLVEQAMQIKQRWAQERASRAQIEGQKTQFGKAPPDTSGPRALTPEEWLRYKMQENTNRPKQLPGKAGPIAGQINVPGPGILEGQRNIAPPTKRR